MSGDDLDDEPAPWSAEGAASLRSAAAQLIQAISAHAESVLATSGRAQLGDVMVASDRLVPAVLAYADAQAAYAQYAYPFGVLHQYADNDSDDEEIDTDESVATTGVTVLERRDYRITDEPAVIAAAKTAYLRVWLDDDQADAERDVTDLGRALYQLAHADGWHSLDRVDGLVPAGASISVLRQDELLGRDPNEWPAEVYAADGESFTSSRTSSSADQSAEVPGVYSPPSLSSWCDRIELSECPRTSAITADTVVSAARR